MDLRFVKPFRARHDVRFDLTPTGTAADPATKVTWSMTGNRNPVMHLLGWLFFDRAVGKDFGKGLAALKSEAERPG